MARSEPTPLSVQHKFMATLRIACQLKTTKQCTCIKTTHSGKPSEKGARALQLLSWDLLTWQHLSPCRKHVAPEQNSILSSKIISSSFNLGLPFGLLTTSEVACEASHTLSTYQRRQQSNRPWKLLHHVMCDWISITWVALLAQFKTLNKMGMMPQISHPNPESDLYHASSLTANVYIHLWVVNLSAINVPLWSRHSTPVGGLLPCAFIPNGLTKQWSIKKVLEFNNAIRDWNSRTECELMLSLK